MAPNYAQGKVYVIRNEVNDKLYVGSTVRTLAQRMVQHRSVAKTNHPGFAEFPLYVAMSELGIEKFYIELLEDFPCERKEQLNKKEGERIREMKTLAPIGYNARIAGRTDVQYYVDNKEAICARVNEYRHANIETIRTKQQVYRDNTKEAHRERNRAYQQTHKEALKSKKHEYYEKNKVATLAKQKEAYRLRKEAAVSPPTV